MKTSPSIAALAPALVKAQAGLRAIGKDAVNPHFKNRYASLDAIIEAVRPVLAQHGFAVVQDSWGEGTAMYVETILLHESGEWMSGGVLMPLAKNDPQGAGGAMTYGRRYGLSALLSLATDEDDDGNAASTQKRQRAGAADTRSQSPRGSSTIQTDGAPSAPAPKPNGAEPKLFFGRPAGTPLGEYDNDQLKAMLSWAVGKNDPKMKTKIETIRAILADRALGEPTTQAELDAVAVSRLADKPDGLPF